MQEWVEHDKHRLPLAPLECVQEAGEVVVVPAGWHHATLNLAESVGLAVELGPPRHEVKRHEMWNAA